MNNNLIRRRYSCEDDHRASKITTKRKYNEDKDDEQINTMRHLLATHLGNPVGNTEHQNSWKHCHRSFEHTFLCGLHDCHVFAPFSVFTMNQPLTLTQNSSESDRTAHLSEASTERQQNRPSVITCAPARKRTCNLSNCHMFPSSCTFGLTNTRNNANTACDPVFEEHFRQSLGKINKEPKPISNSLSIAGSVDDHFTKALGDTWLLIKAKGSGST